MSKIWLCIYTLVRGDSAGAGVDFPVARLRHLVVPVLRDVDKQSVVQLIARRTEQLIKGRPLVKQPKNRRI